MGFSIGRFLGKIAGPIVGGLLGGPAGAILGAGISAGFTAPARVAPSPQPFFAPAAASSQVGPTAFGVTRRRVGTFGVPARFAFGGAVSVVAGILSQIRENTGQRVTRQKVVDAVKHCGIQLAAETFGISETEICQVVISRPKRRGRGISAADLRRTRSTIRKVHNIQHDLKRLSPAARRHRK